MTPETATTILRRTPAVLRTLLGDLDTRWTMANYGPDTFSPFDVVGHLIHGERTDWVPRGRQIMEGGPDRPFPPFDRYAQRQASRGRTMNELLETFSTLREENVRTIATWRAYLGILTR